MDNQTAQRIEQIDREISVLRNTLSELPVTRTEKGTTDLAQLRTKKMLEKEIQRQRMILHLLLRGQPRPYYYHRLPSEMLAKIFQWISDPAEQLKLLRTFPSLGPLMHWEESTLIFKQVYPLIKDQLWTDPEDICRVCAASSVFKDVVFEHLKADLGGGFSRASQVAMFSFESWLAEGRGDRSDVSFKFSYNLTEFEEEEEEEIVPKLSSDAQQFLNAYGSQVWICQIWLHNSRYSANLTQKILNEIFAKTPNLVRLELEDQGNDGPFRNVQPMDLPQPWADLPELRSLIMPHHCTGGALLMSIVQRYSPQLQTLNAESLLLQGAHFPHLEYYRAWAPPEVQDFGNVIPVSMRDAPLKSIKLTWRLGSPFPEVLTILSHYGKTLESLSLLTLFPIRAIEPIDIRPELMTKIKMPKLRHLHFGHYVRKIDWLMVLPSLETLELQRLILNGILTDESSAGFVKLPRSEETLYSTNVWDHLQALNTLKIMWNDLGIYPNGGIEVTTFRCWHSTLKRADYEAHQRTLAENEKDVGVGGGSDAG